MVKLGDTQGESLEQIASGAHARCFGDLELSQLLSRVQSLMIKNGYELETSLQTWFLICSLQDLDDNAESKEQIRSGFKNKIAVSQAMTGRELCEILPLDYNAIIENRANDREDDFNQFLSNLTQIEPVMNWMKTNKGQTK